MAMTKRMTCKFDMKVVYSSEVVEAYTNDLIAATKGYLAGVKTPGLVLRLIQEAVTNGVEAAIELQIKSVLNGKLKEELSEVGVTISNISMRFKQ